MFGKNEIVGRRYFRDAQDKILVTSMFMTLQGEGPFRGEPAFFVRFSKCNLACSFCDTYFDSGDWYTIDDLHLNIVQGIHKFFGDINGDLTPTWAEYGSALVPDKKRDMVLVITGGEPMLQANILPFLERMNKEFRATQIESNGIIPTKIPPETTLVVSPKCMEKNGVAVTYLAPHPETLARADCLKFVMSADQDSPYSSIPDWALDWKRNTGKQVFISPMNIYLREPQKAKQLRSEKNDISIEERSTIDEVISWWEPGLLDMEANEKNHKHAAQYCIHHGLTLNLQIHLFAGLA